MYGHRIAKELEAFFLKHGKGSNDPHWKAFITDFRKLIEPKYIELLSTRERSGKFGMSKSGGCTRAAALKFLGYSEEPTTGSSQVTFLIGHLVEILGLAALRAVGYEISEMQTAVEIQPWGKSAIDGLFDLDGTPTLLSVKSIGYKKSGKEWRGKQQQWVRRGFPELPFEGVKKAQPSWWAQAQSEMHARGVTQTLVLAVAKDIIKAMEGDPYLGANGNGSLTFYAELVPADPLWVKGSLLPVWQAQWDAATAFDPGPALYLRGDGTWAELDIANLEWRPNADLTGTFNPCCYCSFVESCLRAKDARLTQAHARALPEAVA
jgi:hypothetical protein